MKSLFLFLKNWTLPIAMTCGIMGYFIYTGIPALLPTRMFVHNAVAFIQPALIFSMLFITFCKVDPHHLRLRRWHGWLLLIQTTVFSLLSLILIVLSQHLSAGSIAIVEGAMLCFICPTATAGAVVTARLGGDAAGLTTYTIFINIAAAVIVPLFLPLIHPHPELDFLNSFSLIVGKVFPMLICPFFCCNADTKTISAHPQYHLEMQGSGFLSVGHSPFSCDSHNSQKYSPHQCIFNQSDRYSLRQFDKLRYSIPDRTIFRQALWMPNKCRSESWAKEYCFCHLDGIYLPDSCQCYCRRFL